MRFHLQMWLDVAATRQETDPFSTSELFMDELHGLQHQEGRLDCTVGVEKSRPGLGSLEVELNVDEITIERGFNAAMLWLRMALKQASIGDPKWHLKRIEMEIDEGHLPEPRVLDRQTPRSGAA